MSKIAEAWEKLEQAQLRVETKHAAYLQPGVTSEVIIAYADAVDDEQAAVRDLALAVLDEAEATEGRGYKHGLGRFECDLEALREEINKLGGEVDA